MWIQSIFGSFNISQPTKDSNSGMLTISSPRALDIQALIDQYLPRGEIQWTEHGESKTWFVQAPQAVLANVIAQAVADVYYDDLVKESTLVAGELRGFGMHEVAGALAVLNYEEPELDLTAENHDAARQAADKVMVLRIDQGELSIRAYRDEATILFSMESDGAMLLAGESDFADGAEVFFGSWPELVSALPKGWAWFDPACISSSFWPAISKELRLLGTPLHRYEIWKQMVSAEKD